MIVGRKARRYVSFSFKLFLNGGLKTSATSSRAKYLVGHKAQRYVPFPFKLFLNGGLKTSATTLSDPKGSHYVKAT